MAPDIFRRLDGLEPTARDLAKASENLNSIIDAVEERLAQLSMGVEASVVLDEEYADEFRQHLISMTMLQYQRYGRDWALCVEEVQGPHQETKLLRDCSREIRIRAIELLPRLVDDIEKRATTITSLIEAAQERVKSD